MDYQGWVMTFTEFNKLFESNLLNSQTYREAYEITEDFHYELTGKTRYKNYRSFEHVRNKKIKK